MISAILMYLSIFLAIVILLGGFVELYMGIKLIQKAKALEKDIPWWKQHLILLGLSFVGIAASILVRQLFGLSASSLIISLLISLLALGLMIYALILALRQRAQRRDLPNR